MSRSTYIYTCLVKGPVVHSCTVKYDFLNRIRGSIGNGAVITDQFVWGAPW